VGLVAATAGAWGAAAIGTGLRPSSSLWIAGAAAILAAVLRGRARAFRAIAAFALGIAIAGPSIAWHVHRLHAGEIPTLARRHAQVDAVVKLVRDPVAGRSSPSGLVLADATVLRVRVAGWRDADVPVLLLAHGASWGQLLPGQRLQVAVRVAPPRPGDDVAAVFDVLAPPILLGRPAWWQRLAGRARVALRQAARGLANDERGLLPSLVDGDTQAVPQRLRDDMRVSGLSHLEAVSGENLSIVLAVVLAALRGLGLRRRARVAGAGVAIVGFVVLARPSPSVLRAAVMSGVMLVAVLSGRRGAARASLAVAVLALVVANPFLARSIGFVLSVCATGGIIGLAPTWTRRLQAMLPRPIAVAVAVSAAAQLACTPAVLVVFGQLTPYAVPANLAAGVAVVPATVLGVLAAVVAPMSVGLAHPLVWLAGVPTAAVAVTAHRFAALPGAGSTLVHPLDIVVAAAATIVLGRALRRASATAPREIL
jgi:competence protein ComEC